ncbi:MAG: peroxiredoxin [Myxococcota bacterium]|jgi:peroxiredoxin
MIVSDVQPLKAAEPRKPHVAEALGVREDDRGLAPGTMAPDFTLKGVEAVQLSKLHQAGPVLLLFYRGGWCPYCNFQVWELANKSKAFQQAGVTLLMVSVDEPDATSVTHQAYKVPFKLLSDPDLVAHKAFDVDLKLDEASVDRLNGLGIDLEAWSRRKHHTIAIPSAFYIEKGGRIGWSHVSKDYQTRPSATQLLKVVRSQAK